MRYVHYCVPCDAWSPERPDFYQATADRDEHRRRVHHPLTPRDCIEEIPGPVRALASAVGRAARTGIRKAAKSEAFRQIRASQYWQQAVRLLAIGAGVLVLGAVVIRHLG
ncbi:hypothetical protein [Streptomyces sioyaensis]|uniref:hypothetical protein n=1 Tax=Streptomyces sioyaensis TaxID=67364 RepID=UPI003D70C3B0